jgi:hypothetical protein
MFVIVEVFLKLFDALVEYCDLNFGGTCIARMGGKFLD